MAESLTGDFSVAHNEILVDPEILPRINCSSFFLNTTNYASEDWNNLNSTCLNSEDVIILERGSFWIRFMVLILYGIVCIIGLCGNTLVIYVVLRFSKMQTVTNLYIVNLAIADECFLVGIPFLMTTTALEYWPFGNIMCKVYFTTTSINQVTSSMFLLIMSADRFLAVCHPISATKWRTPLIASMVATTAWALSAFVMVPIFMYANTLEIHGTINCNIFWPNGWIKGEATFMMYSFVLGFAIPLTLISVFYFQVILRLQNVGPKRHSLVPLSTTTTSSGSPMLQTTNTTLTANQYNRARDRKKSHRKVTKLVLTVITVYFLCWAPYWVTQLALISMEHETYHSPALLTIFLLAGCLSYSNSAMNPILYAFLSDNFKKSFVKACSCANRKDANATLVIDNSVFPRQRRRSGGSERRGTTCDESVARSPNKDKSNTDQTQRLLGSNCNHNHNMAQYNNEPSSGNLVNEGAILDEEDPGFLDSEDEGVPMLGNPSGHVLNSRVINAEGTYHVNGVLVTSL